MSQLATFTGMYYPNDSNLMLPGRVYSQYGNEPNRVFPILYRNYNSQDTVSALIKGGGFRMLEPIAKLERYSDMDGDKPMTDYPNWEKYNYIHVDGDWLCLKYEDLFSLYKDADAGDPRDYDPSELEDYAELIRIIKEYWLEY